MSVRLADFPADEGRLVLVTEALLLDLARRANPGVEFDVEWAEPYTETLTFYEPKFTIREALA